jgi:hypothetical protein
MTGEALAEKDQPALKKAGREKTAAKGEAVSFAPYRPRHFGRICLTTGAG